MLKIRMQRVGRINMPSFRVIVTEHARSAKTGNFVEKVGTYNPKTKERNLNIERIKYWLSVGAQASGTMHNMLISVGAIQGKKINVLPRKSPPKKGLPAQAGEVAAEAAAPAVTAPATPEAEKVPEEKPVEATSVAEEKPTAAEEAKQA